MSVSSESHIRFRLTVSKYSTARSGLLNAALIARSISVRGKPILSIFAMAAVRSAPSVKADGSLKFPPSAVVAVAADAGVGVEGRSADEVLGAGCAWAGAAGAEGVCAIVGTGVEGMGVAGAAGELAGGGFGCYFISTSDSTMHDSVDL